MKKRLDAKLRAILNTLKIMKKIDIITNILITILSNFQKLLRVIMLFLTFKKTGF